jgi:hypothetical protein
MDRISAILLKFMVCFLFIATATLSAQAQNATFKYFNQTEAGVSFGLGSFQTDNYMGARKSVRNDEIVITLQNINGFMVGNHVGIGVSIGVEKWQHGLFWPLYGYLQYHFKPEGNTFFAAAYMGYAWGTREATSFYQEGTGAFAFSIGIGYKMKVSNKVDFMYQVFYKYQAIESKYTVYYDDSIPPHTSVVDYKIPLSFAGLKIGVVFP